MTTFDVSKLDPTKYTIGHGLDMLDFQDMVEEFMTIVRDDPAYFLPDDKKLQLLRFMDLLEPESLFHLAKHVAPELRLPQNIPDPAEPNTPLNVILRTYQDRRPVPPITDPENKQERLLLKTRVRNMIEYTMYDYEQDHATAEERREVEALTTGFTRVTVPEDNAGN